MGGVTELDPPTSSSARVSASALSVTALVCGLYSENRVRIASVHHSSWYIGMVLILLFVLGAFELGIEWRTLFGVFAGLRWAMALTALAPLIWASGLARAVRVRDG